jgi:hypothetical protein
MKNSFVFLLPLLISCSSIESLTIPIDLSAANIFASKVNTRFTNYADTSGYRDKHFNTCLRYLGECTFYHATGSNEEVIVYTYDKKDSCVLYSGLLKDAVYILYADSIAIPRGRYLLKLGNSIDTLYHQ